MDEKPFRGPALNEEIRDYIKRYILESKLAPGDALPAEAQLAQDLGVGRGTVREAIKALEALGIVEVRRGDGMYVRESNLDPLVHNLRFGMQFETSTLIDLAQIRSWLETEIIEEAVQRARPEHVAQLEAVLGSWRRGMAAGTADAAFVAEHDKTFHLALYAPLDNTILLQLFEAFWVIFFNFLWPYIDPAGDLEDHARILGAVRAGDGVLARAMLQENLLHTQERVQRLSESIDAGETVDQPAAPQLSKPYRRPVLSEAIRHYLTQYIIDHGLAPGAALPTEGQLALELGVARTSVREAIQALESLGIVDVRHGDGLYVRDYNFDPVLEALSYGVRFDARTLVELLQLRIWLEGGVIGEAMKRMGAKDVRRLEEIVGQWERMVAAGQVVLFEARALDEEFHHGLYTCLKNQTLVKLLEVFWIVFAEFIGPYRSEPAVDVADHAAILAALQARDRAAARQAVVANIRRNRERMEALMDASRSSAAGM